MVYARGRTLDVVNDDCWAIGKARTTSLDSSGVVEFEPPTRAVAASFIISDRTASLPNVKARTARAPRTTPPRTVQMLLMVVDIAVSGWTSRLTGVTAVFSDELWLI